MHSALLEGNRVTCQKPSRMRILAAIVTTMLAVSVCHADEIRLAGGDVLLGTVVEQNETHLVLEHRVLGRLEIPRDQIASLVPAASPAQATEGARTSQTPNEATRQVPGDTTGRKSDIQSTSRKEWESHVDLALNGDFGNTDNQSFRIGFKTNRQTPKTRFTFDATYYGKTSDGETDDNKLTAGIIHDWLLPESQWFVFTRGRYDFDQFESWRHRVSGHGGLGYQLIDEDEVKFDLRGGIGARKEFGSDNDHVKPEGVFGLDFKWQLTRLQSFEISSSVFPALDDLNDIRTRTTASWVLKLGDESNLNLSVGLLHEYQSIIDPGNDRHDLKIHAGLRIDF